MPRSLLELLSDNAESIVESWALALKNMHSTSYATRPIGELQLTCNTCFQGYMEVFRRGDYSKILEFIDRITKLRSDMGFKISEVQRAFLTFKDVVWKFLLEEYKNEPETLANSIRQIDSCLNSAIFELAETYQKRENLAVKEYIERIERINMQLEELAVTDGLTELRNRRFFEERLEEELKRSKRYNYPVSLLMVDIDWFKNYNDTFGHLAGDMLLKELSKVLRDNTREVDIVARYGGEEFMVLMSETDKQVAFKAGERIRKIIERHKFKGERKQPNKKLTVSVGVATYPTDATTKEELIILADKALFKAKRENRNKTCLASPELIGERLHSHLDKTT